MSYLVRSKSQIHAVNRITKDESRDSGTEFWEHLNLGGRKSSLKKKRNCTPTGEGAQEQCETGLVRPSEKARLGVGFGHLWGKELQ